MNKTRLVSFLMYRRNHGTVLEYFTYLPYLTIKDVRTASMVQIYVNKKFKPNCSF